MAIQKSIVLVTVDCLRADHAGFMGSPRGVTPFLDTLASGSLVFSDAIAAGVPTYFSFPAILASRYPLGLGRDILGVAPNEPTLATALRGSGCNTAAFLAGNPYLSGRFGYDQGFDEFRDFLASTVPGESILSIPESRKLSNLNRQIEALSRCTRLTAAAYNELYFLYCQWVSARQNLSLDTLRRYPAADVVVDQARAWLSGVGNARFFLWVHLMDPHHPYYPREDALSSLGGARMTARRARFLNACWNRGDIGPRRLQRYRRDILSLYDAGVYWADKQISRLAGALEESHRWDDTVFVVTADHGEEFLEHGARYHHPAGLPEQLIHVPLLLRAPGLPGTRFSQGPFSLIDLAPTLLDGVGVTVPETFQGRSHWKQISEGTLACEPAITECVEACNNPFRVEERMHSRLMTVRDKEYKLVIRFSDRTECFYDLKNDPEEHSPLPVGILNHERVRLLKVACAHLQKARGNRNADFAMSARLRELQQSVLTKREPTADFELAAPQVK